MAIIYWPDYLPSDFLSGGLTIQPQSNVIRSKMDAGPNKARRRYTARTINFTGKQNFDSNELFIFERFYRITLADGVLRFYFMDPVNSQLAEFRFTADYSVHENNGSYEVTLPLERL